MNHDSGNPDGDKSSACADDSPDKMVRCEVCVTEVPLSVAKSAEALDYVHYFCGLNCLQKWLTLGEAKTLSNKK